MQAAQSRDDKDDSSALDADGCVTAPALVSQEYTAWWYTCCYVVGRVRPVVFRDCVDVGKCQF